MNSLASTPSRAGRLVAAVLTLLLAGLVVAGTPGPAASVTGGYAIGTTATCTTSEGVLVGVRPPAVSVRMRSALAGAYKAQYVKVTARLQGRASSGWAYVKASGATKAKTVLVSRSYVTRSYAVGALPRLNVPARYRDDYRVVMRLDWYSPRTGKVEGTVTRVVGRYKTGTVTGTTCRAAALPGGRGTLIVAGTGVSGQAKVTFSMGSAPMDQVVQCRPSCGTLASSAAPAAGLPDQSFTVDDLSDGSLTTVSLRACLIAHPSICSPWDGAQVTPYGPIPTPALTVTTDGQCVNWSTTGSSAGKPVSIVVRMDGTQIDAWSASAAFSRNGRQCVGYSQTRTITVTATDSATTSEQPVARSAKSTSKSVTTPPQPPTVTTARGARCQASQCLADPACQARGCYFLMTTGQGFTGDATCTLFSQVGTSPYTWTQGNSVTNSGTNWMSAGLNYEVRCSNGAASGWKVF